MKRTTQLILFVLVLFYGAYVHAAGSSCTASTAVGAVLQGKLTGIHTIAVSCTADDTDGSFPADTSLTNVGGCLMSVYINPGATAPQDGAFDFAVKADIDADGTADVDILDGAGTNLTTTADITITPLVGGAYVPACFSGNLIVVPSGSNVNDATFDAMLVFSM